MCEKLLRWHVDKKSKSQPQTKGHVLTTAKSGRKNSKRFWSSGSQSHQQYPIMWMVFVYSCLRKRFPCFWGLWHKNNGKNPIQWSGFTNLHGIRFAEAVSCSDSRTDLRVYEWRKNWHRNKTPKNSHSQVSSCLQIWITYRFVAPLWKPIFHLMICGFT